MSPLKTARLRRGWSQTEAARRFGVSQSYLAMLESGNRPLTQKLARKAMRLYELPPTLLPPTEVESGKADPQALAEELAALGYPGFRYLRQRRWRKNPASVLLTALMQENLEARVVEALPWLLLQYWNLDRSWLVEQAKRLDLQNRLGFVVTLARQLAERLDTQNQGRKEALAELESALAKSKLAREESLCQQVEDRERHWLLENRPVEARVWNLLTLWRPEMFRYVS